MAGRTPPSRIGFRGLTVSTARKISALGMHSMDVLYVLPIVPIQPLFGVAGSALSVIALVTVGLGGRRLAALVPESHAAAAPA